MRILQVVNDMQRAGLETVVMNYYRNIDREKIQFDFLVHRDEPAAYDQEIRDLGGKIYRMPRLYPQNYARYFRMMANFFSEHPEYKIIHSHIDSMSFLPLLAAKNAHVPVRIAHSHNTGIDLDPKWPLKQAFKVALPHVSTDCFACGESAGKYLFSGREFFVMKNAIPVNEYQFSESKRFEVRKRFNINSNTLLIGCVGRLSYQKNHEFILQVISRVKAQRPNIKFWLVGEGEKRLKLEQLIHKLGLEETVELMGSRDDIQDLYQAMDLFVLPSKFEGIPMVGVEAQAAGLPCLFADTISNEVVYSDSAKMLPLKKDVWAKAITVAEQVPNRKVSEFGGYDIQSSSKKLEQKYLSLDHRVKRDTMV